MMGLSLALATINLAYKDVPKDTLKSESQTKI